jgi:hypothetical protein
MRRIMWLALVAAAALVVTGLAIAHGGGAKATTSVAATFTAAPADTKTRTCTTPDGTFELTTGVYRGQASSSDPHLNGALRIRAHSVVNTTKGLGWIHGQIRIDTAGRRDTVAQLRLVYEAGKVHGLATGHVGRPHAALLANVSAAFSRSTGFTDGKVGDTAADGGAILLRRGGCRGASR